MTSSGATALDVTAYRDGLVGRGVLLDVPGTAASSGWSRGRP